MSAIGPGSLVLCVSSKWSGRPERGEAFPVAGIVYTVRDMSSEPYDIKWPDPYFRFLELTNPRLRIGSLGKPSEVRFWSGKFRPLDSNRFTHLLDVDVPVPEEA